MTIAATETTSATRKTRTDRFNLSEHDKAVVDNAESAAHDAEELRLWWLEAERKKSYKKTYEEAKVLNRPGAGSVGFFDEVQLSAYSKPTPIIGNVQKQIFDRPKDTSAKAIERTRAQIREFVLHYFMRVGSYRVPNSAEPGKPSSRCDSPLRPFTAALSEESQRKGFGYAQKYFKRNGKVGKFAASQEDAIIDLRELKTPPAKDGTGGYEWIVLYNPIYDFGFAYEPFGLKGPKLDLRIPEAANFLITPSSFIVDEERPEKDILGRYGFGYGFVTDPGRPPLLAYGPGQLQPGIQLFYWDVMTSGQVYVTAVFANYAPKRIVNIPINPLYWPQQFATVIPQLKGLAKMFEPVTSILDKVPYADTTFDPVLPGLTALNIVTGGAADRALSLSKEGVEKQATFIHFLQHYDAILGSLQTWRQFPDWLDEASLPAWVKEGKSV